VHVSDTAIMNLGI